MKSPAIYADFQNADSKGRVRLNSEGTAADLKRLQIELRDGLILSLHSDDLDAEGASDHLFAEGVVEFSNDENIWVARIDWAQFHHASDETKSAPHLRRNAG